MKGILSFAALFIAASLFQASGQTPTDPNEGSILEYDGTNQIYRFKWWGRAGSTYFIQHSDNLMEPWQWVPVVEPGNDSIKEWGFTTTGTKFFARLKYWTGTTTDPEGDDFDQDGVPNLYEVQHGNNPFAIEDSDADGLPDGWLAVHANTFAIYPPTRMTASLSRNQTATGKIYLNNDTDQAVNYAVSVSANSGPSYSVQNSLTGTAVYDWQDISTTGTKLNTISNAWSGYEPVNIGFSFPFYGQIYSQVSVGVNGLLTFSTPTYDDSFYPIPYYSYGPSNLIAPFWADLETVTSGDIYYKQESNRLIIQYQNVTRAYEADTCTFQVILYSDGRIEFQYNSMNGATDYSTVGIEDATRTLGIQLGYYSSYVSNGMAVAIIPASDFFTISPVSGIVSARSRTTLNGLFHSLQLPFGDYTANVAVTHDGGGTSPVNIAAKLTVQNAPSVVAVVYPTNQERLLEGQPITISVNATDVDSQITKVEFYDNGIKLGEDQNSYYQYAWASPTVGSHSITAKATDVYGAIADSAPVAVQILADADHDGMEDAWETTYGLDTSMDDSMEDFDGDRVPNIFEYRRDTLPNDITSIPETDFVVDPANGGTSSTDNIFSTIGEAASKANQSQWNTTTHLSEYPSAYAMIQVKAGVYQESVYLSGVPVLLLGEIGTPQGPVEIRSNGSYAVQLYSASAIDGFVISHAPGVEGIGVYSYTWSGSKNRLLTNCIIKGNKTDYGAAVYNAGNSILRLAHCTVMGNEASSQGRAIYNSCNATINLVNCILWGNVGTAPQEIYREPYAPGAPFTGGASCIIKDGEEGGINENPLLNPSGYLFSNSPAINRAGTVLAKCSKVDINGERRDQNSTPDLGADEYRDDNNVNDGDGLPDWAELTGASGATDDADGDGIANLAEYQSGLNPRWSDSDRDGLSDSAEINIYSSNPLSSDSDLDGLSDGAEVVAGTGVNNPDSDGDGIIDGTEVNQYGSNPLSADSDSDGMPDSWEYSRALNLTYNDAGEDPDFDGLPNLGEYQRGTEPWDFDTDGDGLGDGYETQYASLNPIVYNSPTSDTDNDGMGLLFEGIYGFNPEVADGTGDLDGDGLTNAEEYTFQSDPQLVDTDDDGLSDFQEHSLTTDPWNLDTDYDGLTDGYEVSVGLNPKVANSSTTDSDGDGLADIDEQKNGSNPLVSDTDGDGTNDAAEVASGADPTSGGDGGQAPPPEQKFKVSFEISTGGKTVTASCAKCHNLEVQVGPKTAGTGVTVELERGRSYDIKLKDKPQTWRPAGQEPPHDDTAVYTLWPQLVDGQTITPSSDEKLIYAKKGEVFEYLVDNEKKLLAQSKTWSHTALTDTAKLISFKLEQKNFPTDNDTTDFGTSETRYIAQDKIAYITGAPAMPEIEASLGGGVSGLSVEWYIDIKTERSERETKDDKRYPTSGWTSLGSDVPWKIHEEIGSGFIGGKAKIYFKVNGGPVQNIDFKIRGKNPMDSDTKNYLLSTPGIHRFAWAIVQHESRQGNRIYNQFNASGSTKELPNFSGNYPSEDGWGIAQLDRPLGVSATSDEVYSWQKNAIKLSAELDLKKSDAERFIRWIRNLWQNDSRWEEPPASWTIGTSAFTPAELGAMVLYNGASGIPTSSGINDFGGNASFRSPWIFDPTKSAGSRWDFHDNTNPVNNLHYATTVILDEWQNGLPITE